MPKKSAHRARHRHSGSEFHFKRFQLEDLGRAALVDRAIISWQQGLGKTLGCIALGLIKESEGGRPLKRVLLVVPGQLHPHFRKEAVSKFRVHLTPLQNRRQLHAFGLHKPITNLLPLYPKLVVRPRFFITTYHELGRNNTSNGRPSLSTAIAGLITAGAGFDCVMVDEGTKLQADDSAIALGVRQLEAPVRYLFTSTPIKNRLHSFFWLASWIAGPDWPYEPTTIGKAQFIREHLMSCRASAPACRTERSVRLTNTHHLWRILAPFMIRRRKDDCGESIVPKVTHNIVLQPGSQQAAVYQNHLFYPPLISRGGRAVSGFGQVAMQLNYLRQAALCPHATSLGQVFSAATGPKRSSTDFNPKLFACLNLIARLLRKGEQVLVGSPFHAFSHSLHFRLRVAGVSSVLLDGDTDPLERGRLAELFKEKRFSTAVAGLAAMSEGFDFDNCHHLILPSLSWAYDENDQFSERIWRLTSKKPVHVYTMSIAGTIDERLDELFLEKEATAQLALDCRLIEGDGTEEVDLDDLLRHSLKSFGKAGAVDESIMEKAWATSLRKRLRTAEAHFRHKTKISSLRPAPLVSKQKIYVLPQPTPNHAHPQTNEVDWKKVGTIIKKALAA